MYQSTTIGLPVKDLDATIKWYQQLLGNLEEIEPAPGIKELQLNQTTWLQFYESDTGFGGSNILRIETADIAATHAKVVASGASATDVEEVPGVVKYFDLTDPSQNQLSFTKCLNRGLQRCIIWTKHGSTNSHNQ